MSTKTQTKTRTNAELIWSKRREHIYNHLCTIYMDKPRWQGSPVKQSYVHDETKEWSSLSIYGRSSLNYILRSHLHFLGFPGSVTANGHNWEPCKRKLKTSYQSGTSSSCQSNSRLSQRNDPNTEKCHNFLLPVAPSRWFRKWLRSCCACMRIINHM